MKKLVQRLIGITVFSAIIFVGMSAIAQNSQAPGNVEKYSPVISDTLQLKK